MVLVISVYKIQLAGQKNWVTTLHSIGVYFKNNMST